MIPEPDVAAALAAVCAYGDKRQDWVVRGNRGFTPVESLSVVEQAITDSHYRYALAVLKERVSCSFVVDGEDERECVERGWDAESRCRRCYAIAELAEILEAKHE